MNPPTATPHTDDTPYQATPSADLRQQIMDSRVPKNEREWWAQRTIEKLETELSAARSDIAHYLRDNLTAHQMACAAGLERDQLRAEVKRWQAEAEEMSAQRSHNANQAGRLRAELAVAENWVEHHSKHADDLIAENVKLRAEVERLKTCGITELAAINPSVADYCKHWEACAERAEADTARLNWLAVSDAWFDYPATGAFTPDTMRAAIDAAMKGTP